MPDETTMSDEQGYNGWTNYETWCVNLWLTNDQGLYNLMLQLPTASAIKNWREQTGETSFGLWGDMLTYSLQSVNWHEIYDGLHEEDESESD